MTTYQQTLLIPKPNQSLKDTRNFGYGYGYRRREYDNRHREDVNSIMAFFD